VLLAGWRAGWLHVDMVMGLYASAVIPCSGQQLIAPSRQLTLLPVVI
jgi:hypothetical protein